MKIGIIGAGKIGLALTKHLSNAGYETFISNSRGADSLSSVAKEIGDNVVASSINDVIYQSDIIIMSVPWSKLKQVAGELPDLKGKIVIDTTNNIVSINPFALDDIGSKTTGEFVRDLLPGARLVKAFNTLPSAILDQLPAESNGSRVIVLSGDDEAAKGTVGNLIADMGFTPVDLGSLADGGRLQAVGAPLSGINLIKVNDAAQKAIAIVKRNTEEVQGKGDFIAFDKLFADSFIDHTPQPGMQGNGKEDVKQLYRSIREAFPDFRPEIHWQSADGDKVTTFKTYHGTHQGSIFGIDPTGKKVQFETVDVMRVKDGKITDHWGVANLLSLMTQLK